MPMPLPINTHIFIRFACSIPHSPVKSYPMGFPAYKVVIFSYGSGGFLGGWGFLGYVVGFVGGGCDCGRGDRCCDGRFGVDLGKKGFFAFFLDMIYESYRNL